MYAMSGTIFRTNDATSACAGPQEDYYSCRPGASLLRGFPRFVWFPRENPVVSALSATDAPRRIPLIPAPAVYAAVYAPAVLQVVQVVAPCRPRPPGRPV